MKGITKTVTFYFENRDNKLTGTASLNTQDFDIYIYAERDRNKVEIEIILPYTQ